MPPPATKTKIPTRANGPPPTNGAPPPTSASTTPTDDWELPDTRPKSGDALVIHGPPGVGKTSTAAFAPNPYLLMIGSERGYLKLWENHHVTLVPAIPSFHAATWTGLLSRLQRLELDPHGVQTLILDTLGGAEQLASEVVCSRDFNGDWGQRGYHGYSQGSRILASRDWLQLLAILDRLRCNHGMTIVLLAHTVVQTTKNPLGADFDTAAPDCSKAVWAQTLKWAHAVFFMTFFTVVDTTADPKKRLHGKGIGGSERVLYSTNSDAYVAKNLFRIEDVITIPDDPTQSWATLAAAMRRPKS